MADPVIIPVAVDTWVKVATNVTSGQIHILDPTNDNWFQTVRDTGNDAPTIAPGPDQETPEVKLKFQNSEIKSDIAIDVYVSVKGSSGRIRVDL